MALATRQFQLQQFEFENRQAALRLCRCVCVCVAKCHRANVVLHLQHMTESCGEERLRVAELLPVGRVTVH